MITAVDSLTTIETEQQYIMVPSDPFRSMPENIQRFADFHQAKQVEEGFCYTSDGNDSWLTVEEIRNLIRENVDPDFSVT